MNTPPLSRRLRFLALLFASTGGAIAAESVARQIARFFEPYQAEQAALSRDGRRIAFLAHGPTAVKITLLPVEDWAAKAEVSLANPSGAHVRTFAWADADLLLIVTDTPAIFVVDARARLARKVLDSDSFAAALDIGTVFPRDPRFVGLLPGEPGCAIVEGAAPFVGFDQPESSDVQGVSAGFAKVHREFKRADFETVKLDLRTGRRTTIAEVTEDGGAAFVHDRLGRPRVLHDRAQIPQRFRYRSPGAAQLLGGWTDLDRLAGNGGMGFSVTPQNFHGQRAFPLCFDGGEPDVLYYASNIARETIAIFAVNLRTKERKTIAEATVDLASAGQVGTEGPLVFDRASGRLVGVRAAVLAPATRWLDREIGGAQAALEQKFPGRRVQIEQWDDARARFLVHISGVNEPGRYFMHHRADGRCVELARRAPWFQADSAHAVEAFDFGTPAGVRIAGRITLPRASRVPIPPLLVFLHDGPGRHWPAEFDRETQALAAMGCIVLQLEPRGSGGLGWRHAALPADAFDRIPIEDTLAAIEWAGQRHRFDRRRVGIVGHGLGGYAALRALALQPKVFRCAIAINAPTSLEQLVPRSRAADYATRQFAKEFLQYTGELKRIAELTASSDTSANPSDLPSRMPTMPSAEAPPVVDFPAELTKWIFLRDGVRAAGASVLKHAAEITQPVMLVHERTHRVVSISHPRALRQALRGQGTDVELLEVGVRFTRGDLAAREPVFQRMHEFLNAALYDFDVRVGPAKEVK